jgi:hypothetical protein
MPASMSTSNREVLFQEAEELAHEIGAAMLHTWELRSRQNELLKKYEDLVVTERASAIQTICDMECVRNAEELREAVSRGYLDELGIYEEVQYLMNRLDDEHKATVQLVVTLAAMDVLFRSEMDKLLLTMRDFVARRGFGVDVQEWRLVDAEPDAWATIGQLDGVLMAMKHLRDRLDPGAPAEDLGDGAGQPNVGAQGEE